MASCPSPGSAPLPAADREVDARHALVLGDGPRIRPMPAEVVSPELLAVVAQMLHLGGALNTRDELNYLRRRPLEDTPADEMAAEIARLPEIILIMLHNAELFGRHTEVGIHLLTQSTLPPRERELVVLRIAWLCRAPYEWGEHVLVAKKFGVTAEEVERITFGAAAAGWAEHDSALLRAAEELHADAMISDATWATLSRRLNEKQMIELTILVGQYQAVAYYQNSLRVRLHEGNEGLRAR
jgi:alkylhydroperoxidase family enzyme